ncbi:MAG: hypothetical protein ABIE81_01105 [Candidatus Omnitrophota bacterium]
MVKKLLCLLIVAVFAFSSAGAHNPQLELEFNLAKEDKNNKNK